MKIKALFLILLFGLFSTTALAALKCSDYRCDVTWKTNMDGIDFSTVCYNFKGKPQYQECRRLAVDVFDQRCERGKRTNNEIWVDIYCSAPMKYRP